MGVLQNILNSRSPEDGDFFDSLHEILGFSPKNIAYYRRAFTHRALNKKDEFGNGINFERLEFLGDAVLDAVVAAYLFDELPNKDEGHLTKMRSKIVSRHHLNKLGADFDLAELMQPEYCPDRFGNDIQGNLFEALIGAIYMDKGFRCCQNFIRKRIIQNYVDIPELEDKIISYKGFLTEWCQKNRKPMEFEVYEDTGNEKCRYYAVKLWISGRMVGKARSTSKKKAEEKAANRAYYCLQDRIEE